MVYKMADRTGSKAFVVMVLSVIALWQVSRSVVLTPSSIRACPGDEIIVKCSESETAISMTDLRWIVTPQNRQFQRVDLHLSNNTNVNEQQVAGVKFCSELSSFSPLSSIFMTTAHPLLNGATVTCTNATSADTLTIRVLETAQHEIQWLNITGEMFKAENLTVIVEWKSNNNCLNFTVLLRSSSDDMSSDYNITTKINSHAFNILYNTNYTVTVSSGSGNNSSEISENFNFIKCDPPPQQENIIVNGYAFPALENAQISLSCPPGYSSPDKKVTTVISTCTSEAVWSPDPSILDLECKPRDCGQLPLKTDVYTILKDKFSTTVGSVIQFECVQSHPITGLNKTLHQAECLESGLWQLNPQTTCGQTTTTSGDSVRNVALAVGIPITLVCLVCFIGTAAVISSCLIIRSKKKRSSKEEDKQSCTKDSQNQDNHTIEHWGIYSLLSQPEAESQSTRNSAVYAEIGPIPKGKKAVVMPDTMVQYAVVKKKQQQQQCEMDLDTKVVLNLDELLTKIHSQVSPKWRQFGLAVRVPVETLDDLSAYQEEDRLSEIADYWMNQHQGQLTWREVARIMKEIGLNDLAEEILSDRDADEDQTIIAELSSTNLSDEHEAETDDFTTTTTLA